MAICKTRASSNFFLSQGVQDLQQAILASQVQEMEDLLKLQGSKTTFKSLGGIMLVLPGLTVGMLSQLPGLPCGMLGSQVQSEMFHPSLECHT